MWSNERVIIVCKWRPDIVSFHRSVELNVHNSFAKHISDIYVQCHSNPGYAWPKDWYY